MSVSITPVTLPDETATVALGARLAGVMAPGMLVFLRGDLGVGKTTLCRGLVQALGHAGAVKSPTYTLVEPYEEISPPLYHFDLYRVSDPAELEDIGLRDYLDNQHVCLVEWPERGDGVLPPADLIITIDLKGLAREASLVPVSPRAEQALAGFNSRPAGAVT